MADDATSSMRAATAPAATAAPTGTASGRGRDNVNYGYPISAHTTGNFPAIGSTLGPYFSIGRLGKGTFCSIHKCINMRYHHTKIDDDNSKGKNKTKTHRLAAAKVEIGDFKNSGVLGGEASILHFLDDVLPSHTVPSYMGHYVSKDRDKNNNTVTSAIVMEYLTGQDMHVIRDWATRQQPKVQQQQQIQQQQPQPPQFSPQSDSNINEKVAPNSISTTNNGSTITSTPARARRRIAINDAVYLTANVMLPLLRKMHYVGIVHRDVKPSNVVKRGSNNLFCMVDFGLSKSIVVPSDSNLANSTLTWGGLNWIGQSPGSAGSCYRKEREKADFRGTSMYASVRVHQLNDYCPRDDIWSLLYVFCDLASGGLPWMSHAANRDRDACKTLKERIHGLEAQPDGEILINTRRLLMGDEYHVALFKKRKGKVDPPEIHEGQDAIVDDENDPSLPRPMALSEDKHKVGLLTKAFDHLKGLGFNDIPDYDLIKECLEAFLTDTSNGDYSSNTTSNNNAMDGRRDLSIPPIDWERLAEAFENNDSKKRTFKIRSDSGLLENSSLPTWDLLDEQDSLESSIFAEAESSMISEKNAEEENGVPLSGEAADIARLPMELRFRIAQMDYNTLHNTSIEPYLALRDWFRVALPILYSPWDSERYEKGGHRSNNDGHRREFFLKLVEKCLACASKFLFFREMKIIYDDDNVDDSVAEVDNQRPIKRRRRVHINNMHEPENGSNEKGLSDLLLISKVMFELRMKKKVELKLSRAPPPRLSFGG